MAKSEQEPVNLSATEIILLREAAQILVGERRGYLWYSRLDKAVRDTRFWEAVGNGQIDPQIEPIPPKVLKETVRKGIIKLSRVANQSDCPLEYQEIWGSFQQLIDQKGYKSPNNLAFAACSHLPEK